MRFALRFALCSIITFGASTTPLKAQELGIAGPVHLFEPDSLSRDRLGRTTLAVSDTRGILEALEAGDTDRLRQIRSALDASAAPEPGFNVMRNALCDAAIARTQGNLSLSNRIINDALRHAEPWGNPAQSINPFNFMLFTMFAGNLLLEDRSTAWAQGKAYLDHFFRTPLKAYFNKPDLVFNDLDQVMLSTRGEELPRLTVHGPRHDTLAFNPFQTLVNGVPTATAGVRVTLDGTPSNAVINTASLLGSVPEPLFQTHHWQVIGTVSSLHDDTIATPKALLVLVPSLTLGHTTFNNQLMMVTKSSHVVIGLQSLGVLNHITMTDHDMSFGPDAPFSCKRPVALQSDISGLQAALLLPVSYNGQSRKAIIATGDNTPEPLVIPVNNLPGLKGSPIQQDFETGKGMISENAVLHRARLHIDGHIVNASIRYRRGDTTQPPVLTMSALEGARLSFDLHEGVACLD
ncbi:hypothetical protein [Asaia bogorensis]|uniref:hypothetical protein n=1 Tax=Asaia bogorensis TaxID=91915 RepID=UPI0013CED971|nr:hypothetical protein [Asaia bogorensis]